MNPDNLILAWIHVGWSSDVADMFFTWLSNRLTFSLPLLLLLLIYASAKQGLRGLAWWLALMLTIAIGDFCGSHLKHLFSELRPCCDSASAIFELIRPGYICKETYLGMPSNHALNFFSTALFVMINRPE